MTAPIPFVKMHGIGNDYIFFDCFENTLRDPSNLAVKLSDRHFSVGGDGIVLILPSARADAKMRMFNADGSEGKMCGNAVRCVGKYLYDVRGVRKKFLHIETASGVRTLEVVETDGTGREALSFRVDMGRPEFLPARIPARFDGETVVSQPLTVGAETYLVTCLSMGNPHCVVFCGDVISLDLERVGPRFERHAAFPERVNTEFVRADRDGLTMRVWERGSGETLACGTGACAAAVAAVLNGYFSEGQPIEVRLKGGRLFICYTGETVFMTGPAAFSFRGEI